jgi:nitrogen fixation NifU-like protein
MDLEELLDRYEQPSHRGKQPVPPAHLASASNPRCGDVIRMFVTVEDERLVRVSFDGSGCTISQAAADVTAEMAEGLGLASALELDVDAVLDRLGRDAVRTRLDCASLGLHTLQHALRLA